MITVQETTFEEPQYNHQYLLTDDKFHMLGYTPYGSTEVVMFANPLKFNAKGRDLKVIKK